ncbi:MAG: NAD(P)H-hydrate epimerase, partial [Planctomycetota bacterium]
SLTRREVRSIDRIAIEELGVAGVVLMENAGRGAADAIENFLAGRPGPRDDCKVAVVAGGGNNGGDGFVVARHLGIRACQVAVFLTSPEARIHGDAGVNLAILRKLGCHVRQILPEALAGLGESLREFDLIVDAVGGTGIAGPLRREVATVVEQINAASQAKSVPVVALDIPTGLDCDTGLAPGLAVRAKLTVTFVARKVGFDNPASEQYTGQVQVADIGIDVAAFCEK